MHVWPLADWAVLNLGFGGNPADPVEAGHHVETWQEALQEYLAEEARERRWRRGSVVCAGTEVILGIVLASLGQGSPDSGDRLVRSGSMFDDAGTQIAALAPDGGWQGSAAHAYVTQNLAQSQHAKLIGDLEHLAGDLVSAQADAVQRVRYVVYTEMAAVAAALAFCIYAETTMGPAGQILSSQVAPAVCGVALAVLVGFLIDLWITTSQNASTAQAATHRLTDMLATLPTPSDPIPGKSHLPCPPADSRSEFEHTLPPAIAGLLENTGPTPNTPDVSLVFADLPGSPEFSMPTLPTPGFPDFGAPDLPIPQLAALPDVSSALACLGLADLSTVAQLAVRLSQLTELSGAASGLSQLSNVAGQQAQMISSLAHQSAQQQATLADHVRKDDDNDGAAGGTTTAEPAPVDAATGPSEHREGRVL